jgi:hypothetical protein
MRSAVWLRLLLSGEICSSTSDEADCLLGPLWFSIRCGLVIARGTAICTEPLLELEQN